VLAMSHAVETHKRARTGVNWAESWPFRDELFEESTQLSAVIADDAHFKHPLGQTRDALGGKIHVRSECLKPSVPVAAVRAGAFCSSTGPEVHNVRTQGNELVVACSPVETILITSCGPKSQRKIGHLRVTVRDEAGGLAWTNLVWPS